MRAYLDNLEPHQGAIAVALENAIKQHWPHLTVKLAWGFPCWSGNERVFSVMGQADRCNVRKISRKSFWQLIKSTPLSDRKKFVIGVSSRVSKDDADSPGNRAQAAAKSGQPDV